MLKPQFAIAFSTILFFIALSATAHPAPRPTKTGGPLAGNWTVTLTPEDNNGKAIDDTLTISNGGKFKSKAMAEKGFAEADVSEDSRAFGPAKFTVSQTSKKEGKLEWSGTVDTDQMTGTLKWTKPDGTVVNYTLKGSKAQ